jgi:hypothetical protein
VRARARQAQDNDFKEPDVAVGGNPTLQDLSAVDAAMVQSGHLAFPSTDNAVFTHHAGKRA